MPDSSRLTVALHILTLLAMNEGAVSSSATIAESVNTNPVVVRRVLGLLRVAGLIVSTNGVDGGARLARTAPTICVDEVYRAVESGELFAMHHREPNQNCPCGRQIQSVLHGIYTRAEQVLEKSLSETTIGDLVQAVRVGGLLRDTNEQHGADVND